MRPVWYYNSTSGLIEGSVRTSNVANTWAELRTTEGKGNGEKDEQAFCGRLDWINTTLALRTTLELERKGGKTIIGGGSARRSRRGSALRAIDVNNDCSVTADTKEQDGGGGCKM